MILSIAEVYDLYYSFKDYQAEADQISEIIESTVPGAVTVLDVGCGTGSHHTFLAEKYQMDGIDINESYIDRSKGKNPDGNYQVADMMDFDLGRTYDVVLCLFSTIGYANNYADLVRTFKAFRRHLKPEGVLIVEPWITPGRIRDGIVDIKTFENDTYKLCRMNDLLVEGSISVMNFHYLVGKGGEEVEHIHEVHRLGLYTVEEMTKAFQEAGFQSSHDEKGLTTRGLYHARIG